MNYVSYTIYGQEKPLDERRIGLTFHRPAPSLTIQELRQLTAELMQACHRMETGEDV